MNIKLQGLKCGDNMKIDKEYFENFKKSYMTKEEFIKMIEKLDFKAIEDFDVNVITEFYIELNKNGEEKIKKLGYHIGGL